MFLFLVFTSILLWLMARQHLKSQRLPPGPFAFPLIGNIPQIGYKLWKYGGVMPMLTEYRRTYGDVFTLWLGPLPHVSITDYETSYEVFVKNGSKYADKHLAPIFEYFRDGKGLFFANGENWQELRRFSMHIFRNMGMGRDLMEEKIMSELNARCAEIDRKSVDGVTVEHAGHFFDLTVGSVINSMLMGFRFDERNKERFLTFKHMLDEAMEQFNPFDMTLPVWVLRNFFPGRYRSFMSAQQSILDYVSEDAVKRLHDFEAAKYEIDPENVEDFVDAFLLKLQQNPDSPVYNEETLKVVVLDLWITGQETTTTTLLWAFVHFLHHPHVMQRVRYELIRVTNGRPLSLRDKNSTPFFNATIAEVQRIASILNVNFWRINREPTVIGGHPVDSGALICAQLGALHTNENIFENPEKFDPDRFVRDEKLQQQVIPFGIGKRSCLGEGLAKAELYLIIGNLLLRYEFAAHGALPTRDEVLPLTAAKLPAKYSMQFKKRL